MDDKVRCEKCGGMGEVSHEETESYELYELDTFGADTRELTRIVIKVKPCPDCHGSGKRYLNFKDLREAWRVGLLRGNAGWSPGEIRLDEIRDQWLSKRYGKGE